MIKNKIIFLIVPLILMSGVASAISKCINISLPASPITFVSLITVPILLYLYIYTWYHLKSVRLINILITIIFLLMSLKLIMYPMDLTTATISFTYLYYVFPLFYFYVGISININEVNAFLKLLFILGTILLGIGYAQLFLFDYLPTCLTDLPYLTAAFDMKTYSREYEGVLFYRPNGLLGNPITYGYFLLIFLAVSLYFFYIEKKIFYLCISILAIYMIISLLSRMNVLNMFLLLVLFSFFAYGYKKTFTLSSVIVVALVFLLPFLYNDYPLVTFLIDRFLEKDHYAAASTDIHMYEYMRSIKILQEYFFFGIPQGVYVGDNVIITDGAWMSLFLNFGFFSFAIYLVIWIFFLKASLKVSLLSNYKFFFFSILIITIIENIINSAMLDKGMNMLVWILLGVNYKIYVSINRKGNYEQA